MNHNYIATVYISIHVQTFPLSKKWKKLQIDKNESKYLKNQ